MATVHGPEAKGLLCGFLFSGDGQGAAIGLEQAVAWLDGAGDAHGFVWLHFSLTDAAAASWMRARLPLERAFFDTLAEGSRSTRIEDASGSLIAVFNDVEYGFDFDPSQISTLWASVGARLVVTARLHPLSSVDRLRQAVVDGSRFDSSVALLNHLMQDQGEVLTRIVRAATTQVDTIEDELLRGRTRRQRGQLGRLRRVLVRLARLLAPEPAALFRLLHQPPPWIDAEALDEMRQATEEFSLVLRDLASLQERIKLLQEEIAAQVGEQTNRNLFMLTVVTVLALPINITTGFFGMNVGGVPLAEASHGFLIVVLFGAAFTATAAWLAFRHRE